MLSRAYNIVTVYSVVAPGHEKYVAYCLSATDNRFLKKLMITVQLPGAATNDLNMVMHTVISNTEISLSR